MARSSEHARPSAIGTTYVALVTLVCFALALVSHRLVAAIPGYAQMTGDWPDWARGLLQPLRWAVIILVGLALVRVPPRRIAAELGLAVQPRQVAVALGFALACSAPMLLLGLTAGVSEDVSLLDLAYGAALWPLAEEVLFRGYAFGLLVRRGRWNVWAAALVTGTIFGAVHLVNAEVQVHEIPGQLLSVGLIIAGGIVFAWLFYRWRFNLWIAIGLHGFMNLWYALFAMAETPIGSWGLIGVRIAVVTIAITATEVHLRRSRRLGR